MLDGSFNVRFLLNDRAVFCLPQLCFWLSECDVLHYGVKSKQANAAVACSNGTYQGWGSYAVVFPPGYKPLFGSGSKFGNKVNITC